MKKTINNKKTIIGFLIIAISLFLVVNISVWEGAQASSNKIGDPKPTVPIVSWDYKDASGDSNFDIKLDYTKHNAKSKYGDSIFDGDNKQKFEHIDKYSESIYDIKWRLKNEGEGNLKGYKLVMNYKNGYSIYGNVGARIWAVDYVIKPVKENVTDRDKDCIWYGQYMWPDRDDQCCAQDKTTFYIPRTLKAAADNMPLYFFCEEQNDASLFEAIIKNHLTIEVTKISLMDDDWHGSWEYDD